MLMSNSTRWKKRRKGYPRGANHCGPREVALCGAAITPGWEYSRVYRAADDEDAVEARTPPRLEDVVAWRGVLVVLAGLLGAVVCGGCLARPGSRWVLLLGCSSLP